MLYEKFDTIKKRTPLKGEFICLSETLSGSKAKQSIINRMFKLIPKGDYNKKDKSLLLKHLVYRANIN